MESLKTIRNDFHAHFLNVRQCKYLIDSDDFEVAYTNATPEERRHIKEVIIRNDKFKIKEFIDDQIDKLTPFEKLGIRKLRRIGQHLKIDGWHIMKKLELVQEIKNVATRLKTNGEPVDLQPQQANTDTEDSTGCGKPAVLDY